jgi:hypothetical protein
MYQIALELLKSWELWPSPFVQIARRLHEDIAVLHELLSPREYQHSKAANWTFLAQRLTRLSAILTILSSHCPLSSSHLADLKRWPNRMYFLTSYLSATSRKYSPISCPGEKNFDQLGLLAKVYWKQWEGTSVQQLLVNDHASMNSAQGGDLPQVTPGYLRWTLATSDVLAFRRTCSRTTHRRLRRFCRILSDLGSESVAEIGYHTGCPTYPRRCK